ncbi:hypothetical protein AB1Y20_011174 [Prymnesium parvum]|uniref:Uncharacterized protein n=1 Tax=Prymnesium parvum TaxID=97485 RepID=A0AB34ING0_PRYPA
MRLLAHIAFFDAGSAPTAQSTAASGPGKKKVSTSSRNATFDALSLQLEEMEARYRMFDSILAVVDVNRENAFQQRLWDWTPRARTPRTRLSVHVAVHHNLSHPFRTTWAHRAHVAACLEAYEWFLYCEADVLVPAVAMQSQLELALPLYQRRQKLLGFTRMVSNANGEIFFSDIRKPVQRDSIFQEPGLGSFGVPDNSYAAAWAYPRHIMRAFVRSNDWLPTLRATRGMRERAGNGWRSGGIVVRLDNVTALRIFHVGKSGVFYVRRRGFNSLPADQLLPKLIQQT